MAATACPSREHFGDFNNFMGQMAARYKGKVQAYEIWNEENLAAENGGRVANASLYMDMLVGAYDAIKAGDPMAIVVSGPPSSTETNSPSIAISDIALLSPDVRRPTLPQRMSTRSASTLAAQATRPIRSGPTAPAPARAG